MIHGSHGGDSSANITNWPHRRYTWYLRDLLPSSSLSTTARMLHRRLFQTLECEADANKDNFWLLYHSEVEPFSGPDGVMIVELQFRLWKSRTLVRKKIVMSNNFMGGQDIQRLRCRLATQTDSPALKIKPLRNRRRFTRLRSCKCIS